AEHPAELPPVRGDELGVAPQRRLPVLASLDHVAQLVAQLDAEIEGGPDALGGQRQAVARRVTYEEDPVLGSRTELVRDPVALVPPLRALEIVRRRVGRALAVDPRIEGAAADPLLAAGGKAPAIARRHVAAVDPDLEVVRDPIRVHLEAA